MKYIYTLEHCYEWEHMGETIQEIKFLGVFSTRENAEKIIEKYKDLPGFNKHPLDCFYIGKHQIDRNYWEEGFGFDD